METMKKQNLANYVDILLSAVCPTQLKALGQLLRYVDEIRRLLLSRRRR
jgi:hypothetical protein